MKLERLKALRKELLASDSTKDTYFAKKLKALDSLIARTEKKDTQKTKENR